MTFWETVFAVAIGFVIYDFYCAIGKAIIREIDSRRNKKRAIGFGESETTNTKKSGATARKIGFGEQ